VIDLETGAVKATITDLDPLDMWRDASTVWAIASPPDGATDVQDGDLNLVRIDPTTFDVTRLLLPHGLSDFGFPSNAHPGGLFLGAAGQILQISTDTGAALRRIPIAHADVGVELVSTGTELWALPIESTPVTNGFDNRSRELFQIDPQTGAILRRIPLREHGVMDVSYGYGSLWILAPDDDYTRTFGMHLIRVELPSAP
jgi:hypothetical protein